MTIHVAGPLVDDVQRCVRCSLVLSDWRGAMVLDNDPLPRGWKEGAHVEIWKFERGVTQFFVTDAAPTCEDEQRGPK